LVVSLLSITGADIGQDPKLVVGINNGQPDGLTNKLAGLSTLSIS